MSEFTPEQLIPIILGQDARLSDQDARLSRLEDDHRNNTNSNGPLPPGADNGGGDRDASTAGQDLTSEDDDSSEYGVSERLLPSLGFPEDVLESLLEATLLTDECVLQPLKYLCEELGAQSTQDLRDLTAEHVERAVALVPELKRKSLADFLHGCSLAASEEGMLISDWPRLIEVLAEDELGLLVELFESLGIKKVADLKMVEDEHVEALVNVATKLVSKQRLRALINEVRGSPVSSVSCGGGGGGAFINSTNQRHNPSQPGATPEGYHVCIAVHTAPRLVGNDFPTQSLHHRSGISFEKQLVAHQIKDSFNHHGMFRSKGLKVLVSMEEDAAVFNVPCLVYLGTGTGYEKHGSSNSLEHLMSQADSLPDIVVICMKYGAKMAAEQLFRYALTSSKMVRSIVWCQVDAPAHVEELLSKGIVERVLSILVESTNGAGLNEGRINDAVEEGAGSMQLDSSTYGVINWESSSASAEHFRWSCPEDGNAPDVVVRPERVVPLNNIVGSMDRIDLDLRAQRISPCDLKLLDDLFGNLSRGKYVTIIQPENSERLAFSRSRCVVYEVAKRILASRALEAVFRLTKIEDLQDLSGSNGDIDMSRLGPSLDVLGPKKVSRNDRIFWWLDLDDVCVSKWDQRHTEALHHFAELVEDRPRDSVVFTCGSASAFDRLRKEGAVRLFGPALTLPSGLDSALCLEASSLHEEVAISFLLKDWPSYRAEVKYDVLVRALEDELFEGVPVIAVYRKDENALVVRVLFPEVNSLHCLASKILFEEANVALKILEILKAQPSSIQIFEVDSGDVMSTDVIPDVKKALRLAFDLTHFALCFESAMLRLEDLTPHQREKLEECINSSRVHIKAPAGAGKTFLAVHLMVQELLGAPVGDEGGTLEGKGNVLFITRGEPLCKHVCSWLFVRLKRAGMSRVRAMQVLETRFRVLYEPFDEGPRSVNLDDAKISFDKVAHSSAALVVVDEAQHWNSEHGAGGFTGLYEFVENSRLVVLSDVSQSRVSSDVNALFQDASVVRLEQVVRNTQRVFAGARHFSIYDFDSESSHVCPGAPLETFIFKRTPDRRTRQRQYAEHLFLAVQSIKKRFPGLSLGGRLAIIGPDKEFVDAHRAVFEEALKAPPSQTSLIPNLVFMSTDEAASSLGDNHARASIQEHVTYDGIDHMDGLERLVVIGVGLDSVGGNASAAEVRSRLYRAISRAQLMFMVVNEAVEGGLLEWMGHVELDTEEVFSEAKERERVDSEAITAKFPMIHTEQLKRNERVDSPTPRWLRSLSAWWLDMTASSTVGSAAQPNPVGAVGAAAAAAAAAENEDAGDENEGDVEKTEPNPPESQVSLLVPRAREKTTVWDTSNNTFRPDDSVEPPKFMPIKLSDHSPEDGQTASHEAAPREEAEATSAKKKWFTREGNALGQELLKLCESESSPDLDKVKEMIGKGANLKVASGLGRTALMRAAHRGHAAVVSELLKAGAGTEHKNFHGETALMEASREGHAAVVSELLKAGADTEHKIKGGYTALMEASCEGHAAIVSELLKAGAGTEHEDGGGWTALMKASREGHAAVVSELLKAGAGTEHEDNDGDTARDLAFKQKRNQWREVVRLLDEHAAGLSALHEAAPGVEADSTSALVDAGAKEKRNSPEGQALGQELRELCASFSSPDLDKVKELIGKGANLEVKNWHGETALMRASREGHAAIVSELLKAGVDTEHKNFRGSGATGLS